MPNAPVTVNDIDKIALFENLNENEKKLLATQMQRQSCSKGQTLYEAGEVRDRLRILLKGHIQLLCPLGSSVASDTHESQAIFYPNQFLNEGALLQEGTLHSAKAIALMDCEFAILYRVNFCELSTKHPDLCGKIVLATGAHMYRRMALLGAANAPSTAYSVFLSGQMRLEHDLLGEKNVPSEAYFGIQTLRALENFRITDVPLRTFPPLVKALAQVKKACAIANWQLGLLDKERFDAICSACDEVFQGHLEDQFVVDMIQGGAGTSTNMNANEVIANRALELMGHRKGEYAYLHPNNHVNLSQSTNDAYPTAVRVAVLHAVPSLTHALKELCTAFAQKAREFSGVLKMGRTQLQDAVPMTLGQEFEAFRVTVEEDIVRLKEASKLFLEVNLGGTAIGTGLNAPKGYGPAAIKALAALTGYSLRPSPNLIEATPDMGSFVLFSGILKRIAVKLSKICNDLRLLSSGPRCGFGEINLPAMQPGSSIMPGKVNPVIPEVMNQVAFQVIGNDLTVTLASEAGQLQLNVMEPVVVFNLFQSVSMLTRGVFTLSTFCIKGITCNREVCRGYVERSIGVVTALNPFLGYEVCNQLAKEALETGDSVFNLVLSRGLMPLEKLQEVLSPENMVFSKN